MSRTQHPQRKNPKARLLLPGPACHSVPWRRRRVAPVAAACAPPRRAQGASTAGSGGCVTHHCSWCRAARKPQRARTVSSVEDGPTPPAPCPHVVQVAAGWSKGGGQPGRGPHLRHPAGPAPAERNRRQRAHPGRESGCLQGWCASLQSCLQAVVLLGACLQGASKFPLETSWRHAAHRSGSWGKVRSPPWSSACTRPGQGAAL